MAHPWQTTRVLRPAHLLGLGLDRPPQRRSAYCPVHLSSQQRVILAARPYSPWPSPAISPHVTQRLRRHRRTQGQRPQHRCQRARQRHPARRCLRRLSGRERPLSRARRAGRRLSSIRRRRVQTQIRLCRPRQQLSRHLCRRQRFRPHRRSSRRRRRLIRLRTRQRRIPSQGRPLELPAALHGGLRSNGERRGAAL